MNTTGMDNITAPVEDARREIARAVTKLMGSLPPGVHVESVQANLFTAETLDGAGYSLLEGISITVAFGPYRIQA